MESKATKSSTPKGTSAETRATKSSDIKGVMHTYVDIKVKVGGKTVYEEDERESPMKADKLAKHLYRKYANEEKPAVVELARLSKTTEGSKRQFKYNISREPLKNKVELNGRKITHELKVKAAK